MAKRIFITEAQYKKLVNEMVNEYMDDPEYDRRIAEEQKIAMKTCERLGYNQFFNEHACGYGFSVELSKPHEEVSMDEAERRRSSVERALRFALKVKDPRDCYVYLRTRLTGILPFGDVFLPTPNQCGIFDNTQM